MKALSQRAIEELVSKSTKATSPILLPFEKDEEDVFPIMVRAGGFMVASPSSPIAQAALEAVDCGLENIEPAVYHGTLQLETTRGRRLGEADAILVDFPWAAATVFSPSSAMKSLPPGEVKAIQFTKDNALGRPTRQSAEDLAARWIGSTLDEETAQEYLTGEELEPVEEPESQPPGAEAVSADVVQALQQRILELERQVQTPQTGTTVLEAKPKAPALLNLPATTPGTIDWSKLQQLAGSPPPRVGKQEAARPLRPKSMAFDHVLADVEKEADEIQTGEDGLDLIAQDGDALSKVMMGQLRQNQLLLQKLLGPRQQDPVLGALSGSQQWRERMSGSRRLHPCNDRFAEGGCRHPSECCKRTGAVGGEDRRQSHEEVRGTPHPNRGQQDGGLCRLHDGRSMDGRLGSRKRADAGDGEQGSVLLGTDQLRWRQDAAELVADRDGRTPIQSLLQQQETGGTSAFLQTMPPDLGRSQPELCPRSGHPGIQDADHGKAFKGIAAAGGSRTRRCSPAEAPSPTPQRQREERRRAGRSTCMTKHSSSKEPGMSQGSMADLCALDPDSNASHCSSRSRGPHSIGDELPNLSDPSRVFNPIKLAEQLITQFWSCRSALTAFAHSSLAGTTCPVEKTTNRSLMPVPPIRWRWTAASRLGPRRRRRRLYHGTRAALLNLMLISLNWETLGFPSEAPPEASVGSYHTAQQHEAVERLETMLDHFLHMAPFGGDELGRASEKFQSVIECIKELPKCKLELQDLFDCLVHVKEGFDSYSKYSNLASKDPGGHPTHQCSKSGGTQSTSTLASAKPVVAARVKWESPPTFEAAEFLNSLTKAAYQDPEVLRRPVSQWPPAKPALN